jgi:diguanylate cyclase (GGDEF)-like protein
VRAIAKPKILCVDDEEGVRLALARLLRQDFEVLAVANSDEALKMLRTQHDIAIIISDYRMPGKNGVEFLREAKVICPLAVRAILSGQMDLRHLAAALNEAEIHRFILKPWDNDYLHIQMLEALQTHRLLTSREELRSLAVTDPITGLRNHRFFQDTLKRVCTEGALISLLMIDVDHFKKFNDQYGHPQGDRVLHEIAVVLAQNLKLGETASRYGGEEFAIILPDVDITEAKVRADRLQKALAHHEFLDPFGHRATITMSIGVANFPQHAKTPSQLIESADQALLEAKRSGRNQTIQAKP